MVLITKDKRTMTMLAIEELEGHLKIAVPWFRGSSARRIGVTMVPILGCLFFGATAASSLGLLSTEESVEDVRSVGGFLFSSAVVLSCMYVMAAYWTNRTTLDVTKDEISVYTKPFPLPWVRTANTLAIADVSQLFVQEIQNRYAGETNLLPPSYKVCALLRMKGERIMLLDISKVTGQHSKAKHPASIIEERIEAFLGIENVPVDKKILERIQYRDTRKHHGGR
jgi:hypothetical protein